MSIPYIPLFVADYESDTAHLSIEEDGAYNRLLRLCWRSPGCSIPDDDAWIMRRMRVDAETYARVVRPIIEEFFVVEKARLFSHRLKQEFERANKTHEKRSAAGKKGGRPRKPLKKRETRKSPAESPEKAGTKHLNLNLDTTPSSPPEGDERSSEPTPPPGEQTSTDGGGRADGDGEKQDHPPNSVRPPSVAEQFDEFWAAYPVKVGKGAARKQFERAIKKTPAAEIIQGAQRFAAQCRANQTERQFIKHPQGWLSAERWADETLQNVVALPGQRTAKAHEAWKAALDLYFAGKWDGWREPVPSDFNDEGERCDLFVQRQAEGAGK